ncbi:squalene/phytoene synthase family protein [Maribius pontilimi]|uniref:Squalene/phytoene synthase family protein n=1 Tax=Palleronia pontilimi TaxID=1964209 RepID=A0A934ID84_9RHOB|nr:squalene/phytoene synthase family protein [Palleronia pontilimi]MBJ3763506.1 squalene/phytoene synthase family protein [Palleronia pontilimi]
MSVNACAALVETGDPDRFLAAMAAPPDARRVLFPLYALNLEIARAPYVTSEPMLAEIRLQWYRDALDELRTGQSPRRHEVVTSLAAILDPVACDTLSRIADARRWDIARAPFLSEAQFRAHLNQSTGNLVWTAARLLGAGDEEGPVRKVAFAEGLARWFQAVPDLAARGMRPLVDDGPNAIRRLAEAALGDIAGVRLSKPARVATLSAWEAEPLLRQAAADPARVAAGRLALSPFRRRARLLRKAAI